jgi:hypothetical protein
LVELFAAFWQLWLNARKRVEKRAPDVVVGRAVAAAAAAAGFCSQRFFVPAAAAGKEKEKNSPLFISPA